MTIEPPPAGQILGEVKADPRRPAADGDGHGRLHRPLQPQRAAGHLAAAAPVGVGLPVGVQLVERPFNDAGLIRLAAQLEEAMPWRDRHPAL